MQQQIAKLNDLKIAPRKVRLIAGLIRGLSTQEAEAQLLFSNQRSAQPLLKLLRSAIANAKNNAKLNTDQLFIKSIIVNQGTMLKRFLPRSMGRATPIHKKLSHVVLVLEESKVKLPKRFVITPPPKKTGKTAKAKAQKPKTVEKKAEMPKEKSGFFKRLFQRKSV